jgi:hypothetical protein
MVPRCGVFVHGLDIHAALQQLLRIRAALGPRQPNNDGEARTSRLPNG